MQGSFFERGRKFFENGLKSPFEQSKSQILYRRIIKIGDGLLELVSTKKVIARGVSEAETASKRAQQLESHTEKLAAKVQGQRRLMEVREALDPIEGQLTIGIESGLPGGHFVGEPQQVLNNQEILRPLPIRRVRLPETERILKLEGAPMDEPSEATLRRVNQPVVKLDVPQKAEQRQE